MLFSFIDDLMNCPRTSIPERCYCDHLHFGFWDPKTKHPWPMSRPGAVGNYNSYSLILARHMNRIKYALWPLQSRPNLSQNNQPPPPPPGSGHILQGRIVRGTKIHGQKIPDRMFMGHIVPSAYFLEGWFLLCSCRLEADIAFNTKINHVTVIIHIQKRTCIEINYEKVTIWTQVWRKMELEFYQNTLIVTYLQWAITLTSMTCLFYGDSLLFSNYGICISILA